MQRGGIYLFTTVSMLALLNQAATAQELHHSTDQGRAPEQSELTLPPVEVEARHWREDAQDAPMSVTRIAPEQVERPTNQNLSIIRKHVPNVQIEQSTITTRVVMRGVTSTDTSTQDPVGYFVNDVALPHGAMQAPRLFDTETLEVIKGPQGTLYGRNTEAGAIKVTSASPDWTTKRELGIESYLLDGENGNEPGYVVKGRLGGAIVPGKSAASIALRAETTDGIYYNQADGNKEGGNNDNLTVSTGLELWVGDDTEVTVKSVIDRQKLGKQMFRYIDGSRKTDRCVTNYNTTSYDDQLTAVQSLRVDHSFGDIDLVSVSGWTRFDRNFQMDLDAWTLPTSPTLSKHRNDALSQELRLSSDTPDSDWRWLAGIYGFHEWTNFDFKFSTPRTTRITDVEQSGLAGFGQMEFDITDRLRLGAGGRLEHIMQDGSQSYVATSSAAYYAADDATTTILPKVSVSYDISPDVLAYASYARGYLPGGYNYAQSNTLDSFTYNPEYSWTGEAGVKFDSLNKRLKSSFAGFHTRTTDKQVVDFVVGGSQKISNAGEAEIYGIEFANEFRATNDWSFYGNVGLQHAEATSHTANTPGGTVDYSGNKLPMAADYTYAIGANWRAYEPEGWFGQIGLNGSGPYYFNSQNTAKQGAYALVDAEIGYRVGTAELSFWVSNLFDTNVYQRATETTSGTVVEDGAPRTVGVNLTFEW